MTRMYSDKGIEKFVFSSFDNTLSFKYLVKVTFF